jgi:GNAT superfamily N-acetyltransferase
MRRAGPGDRSAIEAFLAERAVTSMFPLSNLLRHGMDGDHDRAMSFWIEERGGRITDVIGRTREGMVMPSCDGAPWSEAAAALAGSDVIGVIGARAQARPLIHALGLRAAATELDEDEPQYALDLDLLVIPDGEGSLQPLARADRDEMIEWRRLASIETMGRPPETAGAQAERDIDGYIASDTHRVLMGRDGPLCMTGFNAQTADIVQIGGVFTPPPLRSRGHARRAVALHLAEARDRGVKRATLFTSGAAAARAYEAIGFTRVGEWTLFILAGKERAGG